MKSSPVSTAFSQFKEMVYGEQLNKLRGNRTSQRISLSWFRSKDFYYAILKTVGLYCYALFCAFHANSEPFLSKMTLDTIWYFWTIWSRTKRSFDYKNMNLKLLRLASDKEHAGRWNNGLLVLSFHLTCASLHCISCSFRSQFKRNSSLFWLRQDRR